MLADEKLKGKSEEDGKAKNILRIFIKELKRVPMAVVGKTRLSRENQNGGKAIWKKRWWEERILDRLGETGRLVLWYGEKSGWVWGWGGGCTLLGVCIKASSLQLRIGQLTSLGLITVA
jgi:hypothetical protein